MRASWLPLVSLLVVTPAFADTPPKPGSLEEARSHLRAGEKFYDEGRYQDAAREMEAAYAIRPAPDLQYNVAQCYERLGLPAEARAAYQRYLDGKPDAEDRAMIRERIANLDERIRTGVPAAAPAPTERVVLKTVVVYREAPPPPGRGARWAAYGLGGLAVAGLASGITFAVLSGRNADQVSAGGSLDTPVVWGGHVADADSAGRTQAILADVSFAVAGVAALGAVGLYYLGAKIDYEAAEAAKGSGRASVSLAPLFLAGGGGGGAGLVAAGRF